MCALGYHLFTVIFKDLLHFSEFKIRSVPLFVNSGILPIKMLYSNRPPSDSFSSLRTDSLPLYKSL